MKISPAFHYFLPVDSKYPSGQFPNLIGFQYLRVCYFQLCKISEKFIARH
jgi:hypothetical protein